MYYIGTSGWIYDDWPGRFYPKKLKPRDYLEFIGTQFGTVEINYSFYHLPSPENFKKWSRKVPEGFLFSVKASRYMTHLKRLKNVKESWDLFLKNSKNLGPKRGPILIQLQPNFPKNIKRLKAFLKYAAKGKVRLAFEFRNKSWFDEEVYKILEENNAALVIAHSGERYPIVFEHTADFVYFRMHGPGDMFSSNYSEKMLRFWAQKIKNFAGKRNAFIYFNNDANAYAAKNALKLQEILNSKQITNSKL